MDEYIKREALRDALYDADAITMNGVKILNQFPSSDVEPVRHGQWEPGNPICPVCGENKFKDLDADIWCDWLPDYCPNCGAKMDLEESTDA